MECHVRVLNTAHVAIVLTPISSDEIDFGDVKHRKEGLKLPGSMNSLYWGWSSHL